MDVARPVEDPISPDGAEIVPDQGFGSERCGQVAQHGDHHPVAEPTEQLAVLQD